MAIVKTREPCTDRKERANRLKRAAIGHATKRGYACFPEIGLKKWGARRADVLAFNYYKRVVIFEVKSCPTDLYTDKKIANYLDYCNALYLTMSLSDWHKVKKRIAKGTFKLHPSIGVLALGPSGLLRSVKRAKSKDLDPIIAEDLKMKMIFRSAPHTKNNTRRIRIYL